VARQFASFGEGRSDRLFEDRGLIGEQFLSVSELIADEARFQSNVPTGMFSEGD
jgi:hypothetical protein